MKKLTQLCLMLAASSLSATALAGNDSGLYIGGSVGSADLQYSFNSDKYDDDNTAYKVFGGFNFGIVPLIDVAAELSYIDFGSASSNIKNASADVTAVTAAGVLGFNLGPVGLFGKAGVADWDSDYKMFDIKDSDSGTDPFYGIGAKLQLGSFAVRAEYEYFDLDRSDIDLYSVGASYTF
jgi:hypothetical protein